MAVVGCRLHLAVTVAAVVVVDYSTVVVVVVVVVRMQGHNIQHIAWVVDIAVLDFLVHLVLQPGIDCLIHIVVVVAMHRSVDRQRRVVHRADWVVQHQPYRWVVEVGSGDGDDGRMRGYQRYNK